MARKSITSRLLSGVSMAALGVGLTACVTGSMSPVTKTEVGSYYAGRAYSLYYQGPSSSPDLMVLDTAGGLEMETAGWDKAASEKARVMLARALKGAGSFQALTYTDDKETKHSEAVLYVDGTKEAASFSFEPDPEAGMFTLSEMAFGDDGGGDGGGY